MAVILLEHFFELLEKEWRFTFPTASTKVNLTLNDWNEWQQFKNELSQKPKTSLSAYKLKIANVSKKSDSLQFYVPEVYKVPALTSRLLTLDTQLKNLDMYLQLKEVPIKKISPFLKQINIEIKGDDYNELIATAENMRNFINTKNIGGVDELKIDVNKDKPSIQVIVDRKKAGELGVNSSQVGQQLRNSIFGAKAGIFKENGEDYDIYVRFNKEKKIR